MNKDFRQRMNDLYRLKSLVGLVRQHGLDKDPEIQEDLWLISELDDETILNFLVEELIEKVEYKIVEGDMFPPPADNIEFEGLIKLGTIAQNGKAVTISLKDLTRNLLISGIIGSGKTTAMYQLARELNRKAPHIRQLFIDSSGKQNFRHLIHEIPGLIVLDWKMGFPINLLRPVNIGGVDVKTINKIAVQSFAEVFGVSFGFYASTPSVLAQYIEELYKLYDVNNQSVTYPTIKNLFDYIVTKLKRLPGELYAPTYNCLKYLRGMLNFLGPMVCYDTSQFENLLLENDVVIELTGLQQDYRKFLVNAILMRLFQHISFNRGYGDLFLMLYLDEGESIFSKLQNERAPFIADLATIGREFGLGMVISCHELSKLDSSAKEAGIKLFFTQSREQDTREAASITNMNKEQADTLYILEPGTCIMKRSDGYIDPMMVQVEYVDVKKNVSDKTVKERTLPILKRMEYSEPDDLVREKGKVTKDIQDRWKQALSGAVRFWKYNLTEKAQRLVINTSSLKETYDRLEKEGLVKKYQLSLKKGQKSTYHFITQDGARHIGLDYNEFRSKIKGKGDFPHILIQNLVADYLRSEGEQVYLERRIGSTIADLSRLYDDDLEEAIEIEVNPNGNFEYALQNVLNDLENGFSKVTIVTLTMKQQEKVRQTIMISDEWERIRDKVEFSTVKNFLK